MKRLSDLLHARRRGAVADEGGFALIAVLAVIAFTGITISALLGMMITTMKVTSAQERTARERRAADGAIENAIQLLRRDTNIDCDGPLLQNQRFDQGTTNTGDDVVLDVDCAPAVGSVTAATDQVQIVGADGYDGNLQWTQDCASNAVDGCLPWSARVGSVPGGLANSGVSLVHSGEQALRFTTGVTVRRGAAALNSVGTPAIDLAGRYSQGDPGLLSSGPNDCGLLGGNPGAGAGLVDDDDSTPSCDVADARAVDPNLTSASGLAPTAPPAAMPTCAGPVVSFVEGAYDAAATQAVNALIDGSSCTNRTFHFTPGIYSFDGTLRFGDAGSYYVFGAPTPAWNAASGVQASSVATSADAPLCNSNVSGTTLLLSAPSAIEHTDGRVAICPARPVSGDAHPAIYQQTSLPGSILIAAPTVTTTMFRCEGPTAVRTGNTCVVSHSLPSDLSITSSGTAPLSSLGIVVDGNEFGTTSSGYPNTKAFARQMQVQLIDPAGGVVCSTNYQSGLPNQQLSTRYELLNGGCATALQGDPLSSLDGHALRLTARLTLDAVIPNVPSAANPTIASTQLLVSGVRAVANQYRGTATGAVTSTAGTWAAGTLANAAAPDGATADAQLNCNELVCAVSGTRSPSNLYRHGLQLGSYTFPELAASGLPPEQINLTSLQALLRIRTTGSGFTPPAWLNNLHGGNARGEHYRSRMQTTITLTTGSGARCVVVGHLNGAQGGVNSDQEIAFNLLANETPACSAVMDSMARLQNVDVAVEFALPCVYVNDNASQCGWFLGMPVGTHLQSRPPSIDSLSLAVTTDTYIGARPTSSVRIDSTDGPTSSSFAVAGKAWLPRTDLDIRWDGAASNTPLFADHLVLNGLGSRMLPGAQMGTVCCAPPDSRTVELTASIGGVDRVVARVDIDDMDRTNPANPVRSVGHTVDVLRWLNCQGACASVLGASDTNPNAPPAGP